MNVQKKIAKIIITSSATITAGIAAIPIPVADIIPITSTQIAMIIGIGYIANRKLDKKTAVEFLSALGVTAGAAIAFREIARGLIKFVFPGGRLGYFIFHCICGNLGNRRGCCGLFY